MDHLGYVAAAYAIALGTPGTLLAMALQRLKAARRLDEAREDERNR